jgi:glutamine amidotransferase
MCRFLVLRGEKGFDPAPVLEAFRERCRKSPEYQGHGWGMAHRVAGRVARYRSLTPIWEDSPSLPQRVDLLVVHARSAFRNEGIEERNNMPFYRGDWTYVFNGELQGVRVRASGRIGAEKVFHLILQQGEAEPEKAIAATDRLLRDRSRYVRAMNVALTDGRNIYAHCRFGERSEYFTLHYREGELAGVCSEPLDDSFRPMRDGETRIV